VLPLEVHRVDRDELLPGIENLLELGGELLSRLGPTSPPLHQRPRGRGRSHRHCRGARWPQTTSGSSIERSSSPRFQASHAARSLSTSSCDIAYAVSRRHRCGRSAVAACLARRPRVGSWPYRARSAGAAQPCAEMPRPPSLSRATSVASSWWTVSRVMAMIYRATPTDFEPAGTRSALCVPSDRRNFAESHRWFGHNSGFVPNRFLLKARLVRPGSSGALRLRRLQGQGGSVLRFARKGTQHRGRVLYPVPYAAGGAGARRGRTPK
jgi:hypothetical protein